MDKILSGIRQFHSDIYPAHKELFELLANGQSPEVLFVTCADSRIDPSLITQAKPGELFICRNAGNIVPPHAPSAEGMTASIEFAVAALKVEHIVVCGHTDCGAMKGAMNPDALTELPHVAGWLAHAQSAVKVAERLHPNASDKEMLLRVTEQNVLTQLQHLRTHPQVAAAIAEGRVKLHGWVYEIGTGAINAYNPETGKFESVATGDMEHECSGHAAA